MKDFAELRPCDVSLCHESGTCIETEDGEGYKCICQVCNCSTVDVDQHCHLCEYRHGIPCDQTF